MNHTITTHIVKTLLIMVARQLTGLVCLFAVLSSNLAGEKGGEKGIITAWVLPDPTHKSGFRLAPEGTTDADGNVAEKRSLDCIPGLKGKQTNIVRC